MMRHLWLIDHGPETSLIAFFRRTVRSFRGDDARWTGAELLTAARFSFDHIVTAEAADTTRASAIFNLFRANIGTVRTSPRQLVIIAPPIGGAAFLQLMESLKPAGFHVITSEQRSLQRELAHVG